ncbi:MAG: sugar transferase [Chlamydiales bacterium]
MEEKTIQIPEKTFFPEHKTFFWEKQAYSSWKFRHYFLKRAFDIVFSSIVLIAISPLFFIIALMIRLSSPGKAIYVQMRLGHRGKVFKCYKFRTMYQDAEIRLKKILKNNPKLHYEWEEHQKLREDPRIFPFGRFLRKLSLDELPQFWNVLKGDLSIVGPRPYMVSQRKKLGAFADQIFKVKPGITGIWQTSGRSNTSFYQRIILDNKYIETHSFWLDCWLILKTIPQVLFSKNAF